MFDIVNTKKFSIELYFASDILNNSLHYYIINVSCN